MKSIAHLHPSWGKLGGISSERMAVRSRIVRKTAWQALAFAFGLGGMVVAVLLISIAFQGFGG